MPSHSPSLAQTFQSMFKLQPEAFNSTLEEISTCIENQERLGIVERHDMKLNIPKIQIQNSKFNMAAMTGQI
jgi:hypothetical protein